MATPLRLRIDRRHDGKFVLRATGELDLSNIAGQQLTDDSLTGYIYDTRGTVCHADGSMGRRQA